MSLHLSQLYLYLHPCSSPALTSRDHMTSSWRYHRRALVSRALGLVFLPPPLPISGRAHPEDLWAVCVGVWNASFLVLLSQGPITAFRSIRKAIYREIKKKTKPYLQSLCRNYIIAYNICKNGKPQGPHRVDSPSTLAPSCLRQLPQNCVCSPPSGRHTHSSLHEFKHSSSLRQCPQKVQR